MSALRAIAEDRELAHDISMRIGAVVLDLARFESHLNDIVDTLYHRLGGDRIEPRMPATVANCLLFVGKVARRHPGLSRLRAELLWLVDEATRLSSLRHDVVHGYVADYDGPNGPIRFARMKADRDTTEIHEITLRRITRNELAEAGRDAAALADRAAALSKAFEEAPPARPRDQPGAGG